MAMPFTHKCYESEINYLRDNGQQQKPKLGNCTQVIIRKDCIYNMFARHTASLRPKRRAE
ncbi:hypothetical protein Z042_26355 [Chania multitudinisentens RB-25]|uniref:Uncharacterized protein n=1 Tax=Chania multitudinisentens RB-25 TaxID=1441930 RepID=A0A0D4ZXY0_9GAMM|nr:hypothetical protein Z042_26355 [Chania multitudinisentens RB-25]